MKLYSGPLSLFSRKVEIALGEKGLAFEREMVAFTQERGYQPKHPDVLAANPKGAGAGAGGRRHHVVQFDADLRVSGRGLSGAGRCCRRVPRRAPAAG